MNFFKSLLLPIITVTIISTTAHTNICNNLIAPVPTLTTELLKLGRTESLSLKERTIKVFEIYAKFHKNFNIILEKNPKKINTVVNIDGTLINYRLQLFAVLKMNDNKYALIPIHEATDYLNYYGYKRTVTDFSLPRKNQHITYMNKEELSSKGNIFVFGKINLNDL